jgi:hypothetical protein
MAETAPFPGVGSGTPAKAGGVEPVPASAGDAQDNTRAMAPSGLHEAARAVYFKDHGPPQIHSHSP